MLGKVGQLTEVVKMDSFFKDKQESTNQTLGRELLAALIKSAGKGKDEIVQIIGREMGFALAAVLKEPLEQLVKNKKLQISMELVPKDSIPKSPRKKSKKKSTK